MKRLFLIDNIKKNRGSRVGKPKTFSRAAARAANFYTFQGTTACSGLTRGFGFTIRLGAIFFLFVGILNISWMLIHLRQEHNLRYLLWHISLYHQTAYFGRW